MYCAALLLSPAEMEISPSRSEETFCRSPLLCSILYLIALKSKTSWCNRDVEETWDTENCLNVSQCVSMCLYVSQCALPQSGGWHRCIFPNPLKVAVRRKILTKTLCLLRIVFQKICSSSSLGWAIRIALSTPSSTLYSTGLKTDCNPIYC